MKKYLKNLKTGNNVVDVVEADKTTNLYKVSMTKYRELLNNNVTKDYKIAAEGKQAEINRRTNTSAQKLKIEDRLEEHAATPAFLTLEYSIAKLSHLSERDCGSASSAQC